MTRNLLEEALEHINEASASIRREFAERDISPGLRVSLCKNDKHLIGFLHNHKIDGTNRYGNEWFVRFEKESLDVED